MMPTTTSRRPRGAISGPNPGKGSGNNQTGRILARSAWRFLYAQTCTRKRKRVHSRVEVTT